MCLLSKSIEDENFIDKTFVITGTLSKARDEIREKIESLGGKVYLLPQFNLKNVCKYVKSWWSLLKTNEYDVIHGHMTSTAFIYLFIAKLLKIKTRIAHSRNSNKQSNLRYYTSKQARYFTTHMFAVSQLAAFSEFGKRNVRKGKVDIIPNAIDAERYIFDKDKRDKIRHSLGLKDKFIIGHIASFTHQKNHMFVLDVFKHFIKLQSEAILLFVGKGELLDDVKQRVVDLNIEKNVKFLGVRNDVPDLIQAFDILLFPSLFEGLPGVVLECQVSGLPCLISDNITREVQITENVVYYSLNKSAEEWAMKMKSMIHNSDRKSYYDDFVKKGFDINSVSKWYESFYLSL